MRTALLIFSLIPILAFGADERSQRELAAELLHRAYMANATAVYCAVNREATYFITIGELTIPVDCKVRNDWVGLQAKK